MAVSLSDVTNVVDYFPRAVAEGLPSTRLWSVTVNDTVANSKVNGYNGFWAPLAYALRTGDFVRVTCTDGKWLGVVNSVNLSWGNLAGTEAHVDPIAGNVNSF